MSESTSPIKRKFSIRNAKPNDTEAIASLGSRVFAASFGYSLSSKDLSAYLESAYSNAAITSDISNPDIDTIVAVDPKDHVVGFSQLTRGTTEPCLEGIEKTVELQRLYVSENCHGSGIGRKLVDRVEEMAREQGFETMWLGVWEDNLKAQKVYEKLGFVKIGHHDFVMGDCVQTDWIMKPALGSVLKRKKKQGHQRLHIHWFPDSDTLADDDLSLPRMARMQWLKEREHPATKSLAVGCRRAGTDVQGWNMDLDMLVLSRFLENTDEKMTNLKEQAKLF